MPLGCQRVGMDDGDLDEGLLQCVQGKKMVTTLSAISPSLIILPKFCFTAYRHGLKPVRNTRAIG